MILLARATEADAALVEALLDEHLRGLAGILGDPVGATGATDYPYLKQYWSEPGRHAILIQHSGRTVGFVFLRTPASTRSEFHQLAEFYIRPASRRLGIGRRAVHAIWEQFPGEWQLQVHAANSAAAQFWQSCVEAEAKAGFGVCDLEADDGRRLQFSFRV